MKKGDLSSKHLFAQLCCVSKQSVDGKLFLRFPEKQIFATIYIQFPFYFFVQKVIPITCCTAFVYITHKFSFLILLFALFVL